MQLLMRVKNVLWFLTSHSIIYTCNLCQVKDEIVINCSFVLGSSLFFRRINSLKNTNWTTDKKNKRKRTNPFLLIIMESNLDPALLTSKRQSSQFLEQKRISSKLVQENKQKADLLWTSFGGIFCLFICLWTFSL